MRKSKDKKLFRKRWWYLYLLLLLLVLATAATYTWFTLSKTPKINDLGLYVGSPAGIELSWDMSEDSWTQHLDYADAYPLGTILKPVTWSDADQSFYAAVFGIDGRITSVENKLFDTEHVNRDDALGYYAKATFYARSDKKVSASLLPAQTVGDGTEGTGTYVIGTPVWDSDEIIHNDGGMGAECAIRLGFRITQLDENGDPEADTASVFRMYEPNCNSHIDGSTDYIQTDSINGDGIPLIAADRLIRQTASSWTETNPVARTSVVYDFGDFESDAHLFDIVAHNAVKIELYIWLEGQDIDCTNSIGTGAKIFASILFSAKYDGQSGLKPIE